MRGIKKVGRRKVKTRLERRRKKSVEEVGKRGDMEEKGKEINEVKQRSESRKGNMMKEKEEER